MQISKEELKKVCNGVLFGGGGDPPDHCIWGVNDLLKACGVDFVLDEDFENLDELDNSIDNA